MKIHSIISSKDMCTVCGQTPCNCTHLAEGEVYDLDKEYGAPAAKKAPYRNTSGTSPRRHPDDADFMDPDQRRLRADQERVRKANAEYFAKQKQPGVAEGWDPDTKRLEQDVRDALENGDDYTAKQYAKMASTPQAKQYLLNIIKQAMYIDDLGGETDWKGVAEGEDDPWGPQGRYVGDTGPMQITTTATRVQLKPGDRVLYKPSEQSARIEAMSSDGTKARIHIATPMGGKTFNCKTSDLKAIGQGVAEGAPIVVMPSHKRLEKKPKPSISGGMDPAKAQGEQDARDGKPYNNPYPFKPELGAPGNWEHNLYKASYDSVKKDVAEGTGFGSNYAEQLAQEVFNHNPNLDTSGRADELLNLGYSISKSDLGRRAQAIFNDEDFPSDFVSAYAWLKKQEVTEMDGDGAGRDGSNRKSHSTYGSRDKHNVPSGPDVHLGPENVLDRDQAARSIGDVLDRELDKAHKKGVAEAGQQKGADYRDPPEADYGDDYQDMVSRVKKLAGLGPLKTQYDPAKRVYRNMPTAVQPKK